MESFKFMKPNMQMDRNMPFHTKNDDIIIKDKLKYYSPMSKSEKYTAIKSDFSNTEDEKEWMLCKEISQLRICESKICICGTKLTKNICFIKNFINGNRLLIGVCCAKKYYSSEFKDMKIVEYIEQSEYQKLFNNFLEFMCVDFFETPLIKKYSELGILIPLGISAIIKY